MGLARPALVRVCLVHITSGGGAWRLRLRLLGSGGIGRAPRHRLTGVQAGPAGWVRTFPSNPVVPLLKTFLDWREKRLPDGMLGLSTPSRLTHVTTPGGARLFPDGRSITSR
jgi:hypothetical protein